VLFGMEEDQQCFFEAVRWGVRAYLPKDASSAQMIGAVRNVMQGEAICTPKLCNSLFELVSKGILPNSARAEQGCHVANELTCRQRQLMRLVAKGMTNKEIAASLQLSQFTVKNHIRRVMTHCKERQSALRSSATRCLNLSLRAFFQTPQQRSKDATWRMN